MISEHSTNQKTMQKHSNLQNRWELQLPRSIGQSSSTWRKSAGSTLGNRELHRTVAKQSQSIERLSPRYHPKYNTYFTFDSVTHKRFNNYFFLYSSTTGSKRELFLQMSLQKRGYLYLDYVSLGI